MSVRNYLKIKWAKAQQLDHNYLNPLVTLAVAIHAGGLNRSTYREVGRYARLLKLPSDPLAGNRGPEVSALVVVAAKDFPTLGACLEGILKNSGNPIREITIVAPNLDIKEAETVVRNLSTKVHVPVVDEETLLSESSRAKLRLAFHDRYGWVLQQVLTVASVIASDSAGVLVVDADTLLLQPRLLLDTGGRQILTPTFERNRSYYEFLRRIGIGNDYPENTFVPHWMLMQPAILREALQLSAQGNIDALVDQIIELADKGSPSSVCVEYELYAQYLMGKYPDRVLLAKWGNTSSNSITAIQSAEDSESLFYRGFGSVSVHSYLRNP
jgi:hypothetical protein